jgi:hypothetical protein
MIIIFFYIFKKSHKKSIFLLTFLTRIQIWSIKINISATHRERMEAKFLPTLHKETSSIKSTSCAEDSTYKQRERINSTIIERILPTQRIVLNKSLRFLKT